MTKQSESAARDDDKAPETGAAEAAPEAAEGAGAADAPAEAPAGNGGEPDAGSAGAADEDPAVIAERLEAAQAKADEHWDALLRTQAEMENLRKRAARDVEKARKFGLERLVSELLPVKDSMEMGLSAASDDGVDVAKVREGIDLTLRMFSTAIEKFGVEMVDPAGQAFDPELHQAMSVQEQEGTSAGTVVTVVQKGYTLNGRLVRPAMVIVAK